MSIVTGYLSKSGITDMKEVSMLENFFQNPEIIGEMEQAEKNRIRRYAWLVPSIVIISALIFYFFSLGT